MKHMSFMHITHTYRLQRATKSQLVKNNNREQYSSMQLCA